MTQEKAIQEAKLKECFMNVAEKHQNAMRLYFNSHILPVIYDAMLEYSKSASSGKKGDKKFSLEEARLIWNYAGNFFDEKGDRMSFDKFIQSLPKEHSEGEGRKPVWRPDLNFGSDDRTSFYRSSNT